MKIKVKIINNVGFPEIISKGDWIDLKSSTKVSFKAPKVNDNGTVGFDFKMIPLGIAMQLPKGFEAIVVPRSSLFKQSGLIQTNSIGVIDNSYNGDQDEWKFPVMAFRAGFIEEDQRICQFRIQLSQKASIITKLKWLFSNKIKLEKVEFLKDSNRGGFGSTGK